jgi:hypothetical protein
MFNNFNLAFYKKYTRKNIPKTAGFICSCTTNSSAIFDRVGVRDIGLRSLLNSSMV